MRKFLLSILIVLIIIFLYAKYATINHLKVNEYQITESDIPDSFSGFKIVHFSDVLYNNKDDLGRLKNAIKLINEQKSDMVVFTGNLLNKDISSEEKDSIINELYALNAKYKYAVLGDKDNDITKEILSTSFIILENSSDYIFNNDTTPILIVGGDNITEEALKKDDNIEYNYIISLIHKPDYFDNIEVKTNLTLAGHSLGGQVRIPFWGALIKYDGAKKYTDDHYTNDNGKIYISYGLGLGNIGLRLFNTPSINVYRIAK